MARGRQSSRRQICSTVLVFVAAMLPSGAHRPARSLNKSTADPSSSGGTRQTCSPGRPRTRRLIASTRSDGQPPSRRTTRSPTASPRCSQPSSTMRTSSIPSASTSTSSVGRAGAAPPSIPAATADGRREGSRICLSSTMITRAGSRSASRALTSSPRRVLPQPGAPTRVTNRALSTTSISSAVACSRPKNRVSESNAVPAARRRRSSSSAPPSCARNQPYQRHLAPPAGSDRGGPVLATAAVSRRVSSL
jgi:hypothetical protein